MDPTMQEILSFLKEKSIFEDKDLIFMQEMLMGCEKNFKNELENAIRKVEERYKKMIAERVEDYKEKSQLLYERIDELKNEKSENEDKLRVYYEKFSELNDRVSRLVEEMGEIDEVEFNSAENCNGKSRNEGIDNINLVPTEKNCPGDQSFQFAPSVCASAKVDSNCNEQKENDHSDETDLEVETALQASGATGVSLKSNNLESSQGRDGVIDSHEVHHSHDPKSACTSTRNSSGQSSHKGVDNINLIPTKKSCRGDQSFQYAPIVCASARVDSNHNEQKESDLSDETDLEVETALHASGATRVNLKSNNLESSQGKDGVIDSHEVHFSYDPKSVCTSTGNSCGQSSHKGIDDINLVPTEKNFPGDQSFQCAPYACDSARVRSNSDKQKESDHSEEAELDVETALQVSGATGVYLKSNNSESSQGKDGVIDSHEVHFSYGPKSVCTSTRNSSGQSSHKGIDNINLVPTEMNCPGGQSFLCAPSACDSAQVESISNKQKESDHSQEADPLPVNLASEHGDPTRHPLACKAVDCFKNNLNAASDKPESPPVIIISDSDDEMNTNEMACASNRCGLGVNLTCWPQKKEVHEQDSSNLTQKRKRSTNEGENRYGSSVGRQKTVLIPELVNNRNRFFVGDNSTNLECSSKIAHVVPFPETNSVYIRQCEDKVGVKCYSELPPRRSDKPNVFSNGNDSCSTRKIEMFIKEGRKWLSEDELCSSFEKDHELCLNAVCALYRQQISENKSAYSMNQTDEMSITALGKCLIDGDPENKLRITMSEVSLKDHEKCKRLAIRYCHQLFQIYHSKRDRLFCPGAGIL